MDHAVIATCVRQIDFDCIGVHILTGDFALLLIAGGLVHSNETKDAKINCLLITKTASKQSRNHFINTNLGLSTFLD